jgi:hypothetical protein
MSESSYRIGSLAPSDGTTRKIHFSKLEFDIPNLGPIELHNPSLEIPLIFQPWLTASTTPIDGTLLINQPNHFKTTIIP